MSTALPVLTASDFASDQDVRWCPGCGDYSILAQMKKVLPTLGVPREKIVFISGIGCSSRFPYYMNTYGMHSIHGRAPTFATGLKTTRPDLQVWVITGDGDGLSIGGNHFIHCMRRNMDINVIMFNNSIYGLTKGQYSPTSPQGHRTKSTPMGSIDYPLSPITMALAAEASFVARSIDFNVKHLGETLKRAAAHKGTSFVEVYQNCNVFNDGAWSYATDKDVKADNVLELKDGQPLIFGKKSDKGIRLNGSAPEVVNLADVDESEIVVHDESSDTVYHANMLARLRHPAFPEPIGVLRAIQRPCYDEMMNDQLAGATKQKGAGTLEGLINSGETWTVE